MKHLLITLSLIITSFAAYAAKVDTVTVATKNLETPMKVIVITPDNVVPGDRFPVAYVLHGYSGDYRDWLSHQPRIKDLVDQYRLIVVHPDGRDSWYIDSPQNPRVKMESFFINDLIPYIDANYPTVADRSKRAITGLSMGGHGAMYLGLTHSDVFGSAATMSGGVDIRPFPTNWKLNEIIGPIDQYPERWEQFSAINHIKDIKPGQMNILIDCGRDDFFAGVNENFHKALVEAGIDHDYFSRPGAHTWQYWNNAILYHLLFFNEAFNK